MSFEEDLSLIVGAEGCIYDYEAHSASCDVRPSDIGMRTTWSRLCKCV